MSKKYRDKVCVYCGVAPSTTGDHVFARGFFLPDRRDNLPQVPACDACNRMKSELEHYLTALLPFGGRHADAAANLATMVPDRLARNRKLRTELQAGQEFEHSTGLLALPIDGSKMIALFGLIARGLAYYHWQLLLPRDAGTAAMALSRAGEPFLSSLWRLKASKAVHIDLGMGTVQYAGKQSSEDESITLWLFSMYGGVRVGGDVPQRHDSSMVLAVTGPARIISRLENLSDHRKETAKKGPGPVMPENRVSLESAGFSLSGELHAFSEKLGS